MENSVNNKKEPHELQIFLPILLTVALLFFTLIFSSRAFRQVIHIQTTIEAIFKDLSHKYISNFQIQKPKQPLNQRKSKCNNYVQKQYSSLEKQILNFDELQSSITFQSKVQLKQHNQLVYGFFKSFYQTLTCECCRSETYKVEKRDIKIFDSKGSIKSLNYQLNFLFVWVLICFTVAVINYINVKDDGKYSLLQFLVVIFTCISTLSGLILSHYMNKRYEANLIKQVAQVFEKCMLAQSEKDQEEIEQIKKYEIQQLSLQSQSSLNKIFGVILAISFSFSMCIYIMMNMKYEIRMILLYSFMGSQVLDILLVRNIALFAYAMGKTFVNLVGQYRQNKKDQKKCQIVKNMLKDNHINNVNNSSNNQYVSDLTPNPNLLSQNSNMLLFNQVVNTEIKADTFMANYPSMDYTKTFIDDTECNQNDSTAKINQLFMYNIQKIIYDQENEEKPASQFSDTLQKPKIKLEFYQQKKLFELALLSFSDQTYGSKGTFKILRNIKHGLNFELIEKIKDKVFNPIEEVQEESKEEVKLLNDSRKFFRKIDISQLQTDHFIKEKSRDLELITINDKQRLSSIKEVKEAYEQTQTINLPQINQQRKLPIDFFEIDLENQNQQNLHLKLNITSEEDANYEQKNLNHHNLCYHDESSHSLIQDNERLENLKYSNSKIEVDYYQTKFDDNKYSKSQHLDQQDLDVAVQNNYELNYHPVEYQELQRPQITDDQSLKGFEDEQSARIIQPIIDFTHNKSLDQYNQHNDDSEYQAQRQRRIRIPEQDILPVIEQNQSRLFREINLINQLNDISKEVEDESAAEIKINRKKKRVTKKKQTNKKSSNENKENSQAVRVPSTLFNLDTIIQVDSLEERAAEDQRRIYIDKNEYQSETINVQSRLSHEYISKDKDTIEENLRILQNIKEEQKNQINSYRLNGQQYEEQQNEDQLGTGNDEILIKTFNKSDFQGNSNTYGDQSYLDYPTQQDSNRMGSMPDYSTREMLSLDATQQSFQTRGLETRLQPSNTQHNSNNISNLNSDNTQNLMIHDYSEDIQKRAVTPSINDINQRLFRAQNRNRKTSYNDGGFLNREQSENLPVDTLVIIGADNKNTKPPLNKRNHKNKNNISVGAKKSKISLKQSNKKLDKSQSYDEIEETKHNQELNIRLKKNIQIYHDQVDEEESCHNSQSSQAQLASQGSFVDRVLNHQAPINVQRTRFNSKGSQDSEDAGNGQINFYKKNVSSMNQSSSSSYKQADTTDTIHLIHGRKRSDNQKIFEMEQERLNRQAIQNLNLISQGSHENLQSKRSQNQLGNVMKIMKDEKQAPLVEKQLQNKNYLKFSGLSQLGKAYKMESQQRSASDGPSHSRGSENFSSKNSIETDQISTQRAQSKEGLYY
ncbi:UNKNOWN [Stylonychia lemnae]|uniref:Transmembrane protein n=1 Tax=Stylonychia lemnae TaxID=5949 RepID=A0A078A8B4_STYLE|nr:UNKNOWN [Stylonychia lemnae]|eukprot:CDW78500.1 UNKNOWN [Stylonychia lemnae]